jgi:hypothetical protein
MNHNQELSAVSGGFYDSLFTMDLSDLYSFTASTNALA